MVFLLLICIEVSFAGDTQPEYIVSPNVPLFVLNNFSPIVENQQFHLWDYIPVGCWETFSDSYVEYQDNEVNVFNHESGLLCASPQPPPHYSSIAEIDGLSAGAYQLNFYKVPRLDAFPPNASDYPNYLAESFSFRVLGAVTIDSSSPYSLTILVLFLLLISRKKYAQFMK